MDIINTTTYNKDTVLRFQQFNARLFKKYPRSTEVLFALVIVSLIAGAFLAIRAKAWLYVLVVAFAVYLFARRYYALFIAPGKKFDKSSFADLTQRYAFHKNGFTITVNGREDKAYYERLFDIWETPDAFYLYANARQAYIVSKDGFESGTAETLAAFLKNKVPAKKYKTVKR
ncbi:MAG: YcxB family protein [Clostridiales bacterium]|nr:YcxB family protein [Clostridiales bacterium]